MITWTKHQKSMLATFNGLTIARCNKIEIDGAVVYTLVTFFPAVKSNSPCYFGRADSFEAAKEVVAEKWGEFIDKVK